MKQILQDVKSGKTYVAEVPLPEAGAGQVLVRVRASAVSAGTERMLLEFARSSLLGKIRRRPDLFRQAMAKARRDGFLAAWTSAQGRLNQPLPLGYSCAGVVEAVGDGVETIAVGDRVACAGAGHANHAEFVAVPENLCARLPGKGAPTFEQAAFATLGAIALQGFRLCEAKLGENVAVIGLGVLGQLAGRVARAAGCRVFGVDLSAARLKAAEAAGIDARARPEAEEAAAAFTGGRGFDAVLIAADGATNDPVELAASLCQDRGVIVAVGNVSLNVPRAVFYRKELTLRVSRSYGPGRYDPLYEEAGLDYPYAYVRWTERRNIEEFVRLLAERLVDLEPLITHRLPIESGAQAYDLITAKAEAPILGVVLTCDAASSAQAPVVVRRREIVGSGGVGILGAGQFAAAVMLPILESSGADLRMIFSRSGAKARAAADRHGIVAATSSERDVLAAKDISTVVILTRHDQHARQVCETISRGKHVFVEKPLCLTAEELDEIDKARRESGCELAVGFNRRFAPMSLRTKDLLSAIREPKSVQIRINGGGLPADHWLLDPSQGGRLLGEGCHFIDWANFVIGEAPLSADCRAVGRRPAAQDWSLRLCYPDGSVADILYTSAGDLAGGKERYEAHAGGVTAVLEDFRRLTIFRGGRPRRWRSWLRSDKGHRACWESFWMAVSNGRPAPVAWADVRKTMAATLAARESLASGKPVEVRA